MPLNLVALLSNVVDVLVPLSAFFILNEHLNALRWAGIGLVTLGLIMIAPARETFRA